MVSKSEGPAPRRQNNLGLLCLPAVRNRGKYHLDCSVFYRYSGHSRTLSDIKTSLSHAHSELRKQPHTLLWCTAEETQDLHSRQLLKSLFLRSPGSGRSEICRRTDDATDYSAFPHSCPPFVDHHPFHRPGCVHHPVLHNRTSQPGFEQ